MGDRSQALDVLPYRPELIKSPEEFLRLRKATFPLRTKRGKTLGRA